MSTPTLPPTEHRDLTPLSIPRASAWRILTSCLGVLARRVRVRWYLVLADRAKEHRRRALIDGRYVEALRWYQTQTHYLVQAFKERINNVN